MSDFGIFESAVATEFNEPARLRRRAETVKTAYGEIVARVGGFLANSKGKDEFLSRMALVNSDIVDILRKHNLSGREAQKVMRAIAEFAEKANDPVDTDDDHNPGINVPWGRETTSNGERPPDHEKNDVQLEHVAADSNHGTPSGATANPHPGDDYDSTYCANCGGELQPKGSNWLHSSGSSLCHPDNSSQGPRNGSAKKVRDRRTADWYGGDNSYDPVQGIDIGDMVMTTQYSSDSQIPPNSQGTIVQMNGPDALVDFQTGGESSIPVQDLEKVGQKTAGKSSAAWAWDSDSNSYRSASNEFRCACGGGINGVGQHKCQCGRTYNMSAIFNASKKANGGLPMYLCREVDTNDRLVLANNKRADWDGFTQNVKDLLHLGPDPLNDPHEWETSTINEHQQKAQQYKKDQQQHDSRKQADEGYFPPENKEDQTVKHLFADPGPEPKPIAHDFEQSEHHKNGYRVSRSLRANAGLWPIVNDKDLQKNWQALMGIVTDPSQIIALEHGDFQQLIADLYDELCRRGLNQPDPNNNSGLAQQMGMGGMPGADPTGGAGGGAPAPGGQQSPVDQAAQQMTVPGQGAGQNPKQPQPSPTALAYRKGFRLGLKGYQPLLDEPVEVMAGWVLGLNQRMAVDVPDPYENRSTVYDGSEPAIPGIPVSRDDLIGGSDIPDPTEDVRDDYASDADRKNAEGQDDPDAANHPEDFAPKSGPSYENRKVNARADIPVFAAKKS